MKTFIAFFDILGFKKIIEKRDIDTLKNDFDNLLRDTQRSIAGNKSINNNNGTVSPDISNGKVNCLHISDSIIFWTNSAGNQEFKDISEVCYNFYSRSLQTNNFLLRGCLTYGEIDFNPTSFTSHTDTSFYNFSMFGKGLVRAYSQADALNLSVCIIDNSVFEIIGEEKLAGNKNICQQTVSMKGKKEKTEIEGEIYEYTNEEKCSKYVFKPAVSYNDESFENTKKSVQNLFARTEVGPEEYLTFSVEKIEVRVKFIMDNTINFLETFKTE